MPQSQLSIQYLLKLLIRFYSSSLLIIYEGKQPLGSNGECCSTKYFYHHQDSIDFETSAVYKKVKGSDGLENFQIFILDLRIVLILILGKVRGAI